MILPFWMLDNVGISCRTVEVGRLFWSNNMLPSQSIVTKGVTRWTREYS